MPSLTAFSLIISECVYVHTDVYIAIIAYYVQYKDIGHHMDYVQ